MPNSHRNEIWITGAAGVLGYELTRYFAAQRVKSVKAITRGPFPGVESDVVEHRRCKTVFDPSWMDGANPASTVIHCAGLSNPRTTFASLTEMTEAEVVPHIRMVEAMLDSGWSGRLIFMSSGGAIYGDTPDLPIKETHSCTPKSAYGLQKLLLEHALAYLARTRGFELIALRASNPYGSTVAKANQGVMPILINAFRTGETFPIFGDGTALRDYLFIADFCEAVGKAVNCDLPEKTLTLNIGSGVGISLNEVIHLIGTNLGKELNCEHRPLTHDVSSNVLCCDKAKARLGWSARTSLETGLNLIMKA